MRALPAARGACGGGAAAPSQHAHRKAHVPFPPRSPCTHARTLARSLARRTGRKRRCGWFDAVVVRYSHAINGFTALNLTKLDVLDELATIKIAVAYKLRGVTLPPQAFPALLEDLSAVEVEYETMPGWQTSTRGITTFAGLPKRAQAYIKRIERLTGVPVAYIGTGPGRDEMVTRGFSFD